MTVGTVKPLQVNKEFEKNPDISPDEIAKLREWLRKQPHLPQHISDLQLILTYHSCLCSMELSKKTLDLHYTLRTLFTNYFLNRDYDRQAEHTANTVLIAKIPSNSSGHQAIYGGLLDADPRNFSLADVVRNFMMVVDLWQLETGTWPGFHILIDMNQVVLGHLARLDLITIKQLLYFLQEAMLVRLKGVHFLNAPSFMDKLMMLLRPFMKKELLDMVFIHQVGAKTLEQHFPISSLPSDAGGGYKSRSILKDETIDLLKSNRDWFKQENMLRVDESKRPGKKPDFSDLCGMQGNFKKLELD